MGALNKRRIGTAIAVIALFALAGCGPPGENDFPLQANAPTTTTLAQPTTVPPLTIALTIPSASGTPTTRPSAQTAGGRSLTPTAMCYDGTLSYALRNADACLQHGGVSLFYP